MKTDADKFDMAVYMRMPIITYIIAGTLTFKVSNGSRNICLYITLRHLKFLKFATQTFHKKKKNSSQIPTEKKDFIEFCAVSDPSQK